MKKIFVLTGEPSGDKLASTVVTKLQQNHPEIEYLSVGGFHLKKLGVKSAKELDGASVCIQTGTTTELNLAEFFAGNSMKYNPVPIETNAEAQELYKAGRCDVYTTDASGLYATKMSLIILMRTWFYLK